VHFTEIKQKIQELVEDLKVYKQSRFYIIRDVFGRISVYIEGEQEKEVTVKKVEELLYAKVGDKHWVNSVEWVEADSFLLKQIKELAKELEGTNNVFFIERHVTRLHWFREEEVQEKIPVLKNKNTKVVTFYSFKGGLGRTTCLVLTALQLVRKGKKVVVIDFDLEAPGLASLLIPEEGNLPKYGVVDYILESQIYGENYSELDIDDYVYAYQDKKITGSKGGELYVLPASNLNLENTQEYLEKMGRIDFGTPTYFQEMNPIRNMLTQITERFSPDFIFLDARTGINDVGGLMLSRFSDLSVLLFYGNEQNMAGMKIILPKIIDAKVPFFLINGPIPIAEEEEREEKLFFLEHTYTTLIESGYYSEDEFPDMFDETAAHFPFNVYYNPMAMLINSNEKVRRLLEDNGEENVYFKLAEQIATYSLEQGNDILQNVGERKEELLSKISNIIDGDTAASEHEFLSDQDLKNKFYPLKEHRFIFEADKFLILGSKGSGKTALFSVLEHPNYARDLASFVGLSDDFIKDTYWVTGLKQRAAAGEFPTKENFEAVIKQGEFSTLRRYWRLLALRSVYRQLKDKMIPFPKRIEEVINGPLSSIRKEAENIALAEEIEEFIETLNSHLVENNKKIVIVYDGLDVLFEKKFRGRMISALISLWYEYLTKYHNIKVKIFLREDIFRNEVKEIADKVKLRNYSVDLSWTFDELLSMVWKRMAEKSAGMAKIFETALRPLGLLLVKYNNLLGYVPKADEEANKAILKSIVGERMGTGNAAFSFNWIKNHLADTNEEIVPRSILKLFAAAARKESEQLELIQSNVLIKPKSFQSVMREVSEDRVVDLIEEYSEYASILLGLKDYLPNFPANEDDLKIALKKLGVEEGKEKTIIDDFVEIGVMKSYQRRKSDPIRYHIPDIFLIGLGLTRRGPWGT
jgi:hypothetical protein